MFRVIFLSSQCKNEKGLERMVRDLSANRFPAFPLIGARKETILIFAVTFQIKNKQIIGI